MIVLNKVTKVEFLAGFHFLILQTKIGSMVDNYDKLFWRGTFINFKYGTATGEFKTLNKSINRWLSFHTQSRLARQIWFSSGLDTGKIILCAGF